MDVKGRIAEIAQHKHTRKMDTRILTARVRKSRQEKS